MRKRHLISLGCWFVLAAMQLAIPQAQAEGARGSQPPNILFILSDDLRWDMAGTVGNSVIQTPNLDRIATNGAKFSNFYCGAPLCSPSRALFLTGLYPHQMGNGTLTNETWREFAESTPTIATHLNGAGYVTCFVGKAHLGGDPRSWGFQDTPLYLRKGASEKDSPRLISGGREKRFRDFNITTLFSRTALDFIAKQASKPEPWFLMLSTTAPHGPSCSSCQVRFPYNEQNIINNPPPGFPPGHNVNFDWSDYYSQISVLDSEIGLLLDTLDSTGQAANTYVFFTSDNGLTLGQDESFGKGVWFEESAKVMCLAQGPGITGGTTITDPGVGVDILPTFLELAGLSVPSGLEGQSLVSVLTGGPGTRSIVYSEVQGNRTGHWQMVYPFSGVAAGYKYVKVLTTGEEHLYHTSVDPFETLDLIDATPPASILAELVQLHQDWQAATP